MLSRFVLAIGLVASHAAFAWDREPSAVFGIQLGETIPIGSIPSCQEARNAPTPEQLCIKKSWSNDKLIFLHGLPIKKVTYTGTANLLDGKVQSIHVGFMHTKYDLMKAIMIERYGPPSGQEASSVTSQGGATVGNETLRWDGARNSIVLFERWERIDESLAVFSNNALRSRGEQMIEEQIKGSASKM